MTIKNSIILFVLLTTIFVANAGFQQKRNTSLETIQKEIAAGGTLAWSRHVTGQDVNDMNQWDDFRSVACIPGRSARANGDTRLDDEVWVVVDRTIDGNDYKFIEQFQPLDWGDDPNYCWFVDCAPITDINMYTPGTPEVLGDYPTLRTTTAQADPGLTHTTPISNVTELQAITATGNYYLTGNIDASATSGWNGGAGFVPIGPNLNEFTGTFDGCGYTITGLTINRSGFRIGLFGEVLDPAKIANVTLASVNITATQGSYVGALVGYIDAGSGASSDVLIQNCHSSGSITIAGTTYTQIGGLIGFANGDDNTARCEIYDCSSSVNMSTSTTQFTDCGGLIGKAVDALVYNCYATGTVNVPSGAYSSDLGGLIGYISDGTGANDGSEIEYCYATGNVTGTDSIGGFVGVASGKGFIRKCYATGNITAHDELDGSSDSLGGFVGGITTTKEITDCYAWGNVVIGVTGYSAGGFVGQHASNCIITNTYSTGTVTPTDLLNVGGYAGNADETDILYSFWDTQTSGLGTSDGGTGHITTWMKRKSNFVDAGWDMDTIWYQAYTPPVPEVNIPNPFIGESVCVYADGRPIGSVIVDPNGEVDPNGDYTVCISGLNYYSIYESFPLSTYTDYGPMKTQKANIYNVRMDFYETMGCNLGVSLTNSSALQFSDDDFATAIPPYTGPMIATFPRGVSREPIIFCWIWDPVSLCIRGMYINSQVIYDFED